MRLQEFIEMALTDIMKGIESVDEKSTFLSVRPDNKVIFTINIAEGSECVNCQTRNFIKVVNASESKNTKEEVCGSITFEAYIDRRYR